MRTSTLRRQRPLCGEVAQDYSGNPPWPRQREWIAGHLAGSFYLTNQEFRLWVELAFNWGDDNPVFFIDLKELSEVFNRSTATIDRWLRALAHYDLLDIERDDRAIRVTLTGF